MTVKIFTDLVDALGKVGRGLQALANFPKDERDRYRGVLDETYRLLDTAISLVINRINELRQVADDNLFMMQVEDLRYDQKWMNAEREIQLCANLRAVYSEAQRAQASLRGAVSIADWDELLHQMDGILQGEAALASFISQKMLSFIDENRQNTPAEVRKHLTVFRNDLLQERQQLIQDEIGLMNMI